ncbi:MAG: MBL fold metallo-hydrolase [Treponema sp.]|jgi:glyoxylase-like metal-dependent hydrolase (beta-lactamase superfamily II)|nr:MBL fold metallo-hydrolase [Treponema sp.]
MSEKNIIHLTVGQIATNCWIYPLGDGTAAVIDPGDEADAIISALKRAELIPKFILLTHGHFDHINAVPQITETFSPKPQIAVHRLDSHYFGEDAYKVHSVSIKAAMGSSDFIDTFWKEMPPADILLEEGSVIGPFITLHLPGHTGGSAAFFDQENGILFTGDTLFRSGYGRTDLPGGDGKQIIASLRRLFAMDGKIAVYPGHGGTTTIERERG